MAVTKGPLSLIDANTNRAKEGIRVSEDILRFMLNKKKSSSLLKKIRHEISRGVCLLAPDYKDLLKSRDAKHDVGKNTNLPSEFVKTNIREILISNFKRAEESLRVLEEISKIKNIKAAKLFKQLRYMVYEEEKKILLNLKF